MKTPLKIIVLISIIILSGFFINSVKNENKTTTDTKENLDPTDKCTSDLYEIKALKLPDYMDFAGESVPLSDKEVHERIDREMLVNTYWQSNGLLLLKRANKYFPIIEPILARNGVPDDFKYLAVTESGLQNVTSPAGAKGFWQFMKVTGREYKLEINKNIDERLHLEKATEAACQYLKSSKAKFGSWTLAAAAYNAGNKRISDNLAQQQTDNYYDLLLNEETSRYVPRIVAVKEILSHPKKYGFSFDQDDLYNEYATYEISVDSVVTNFATFAKTHNMSYKELKKLNPWLRENHLNNKSRKEYLIRVMK